jgi:hypothetical protein
MLKTAHCPICNAPALHQSTVGDWLCGNGHHSKEPVYAEPSASPSGATGYYVTFQPAQAVYTIDLETPEQKIMRLENRLQDLEKRLLALERSTNVNPD